MSLFRSLAVSVAVLAPMTAQAHFVWIAVNSKDNPPTAEIYFAETPEADAARLIEKIAPKTKAWAGETALELTPRVVDDAGLLAAPVTAAAGELSARCDYGIFSKGDAPRLLTYFARYANKLGAAAKSPAAAGLAISAARSGDAIEFAVLAGEKPVADCEFVAITPKGDEETLTTDGEGRAKLGYQAGRWAVRARQVEKTSGKLGGQRYDEAWTVATLVVDVADEAPAGNAPADANQLLKTARAGRAVWNNFPGFTAKAKIAVDEHSYEGKIAVDAKGKVELTGVEGGGAAWVTQQLMSLVRHRMPAPFSDSAVHFVDEQGSHPLGRLVEFDDASLHSAYRIKDGVITEVHRTQGDARFTITTLDVYRNEAGRYVPADFVADFWDAKSGELTSSEAVHDEWTSVGGLELPSAHVVVKTTRRGRQVMRVDFSDHQLLGDPDATAKR